MPKIGLKKGNRGGRSKMATTFNNMAADSTKSTAFDAVHDASNAFEGDAGYGSNFTTSHLGNWGGVGK